MAFTDKPTGYATNQEFDTFRMRWAVALDEIRSPSLETVYAGIALIIPGESLWSQLKQMASFGLVTVVVTVPLLVFVLAGVLEFRRDRRSLRSLVRALPLVFAAIASILLLTEVYFSLVPRLSRVISALSLVVALASFVCRYKSRLTAGLIFIGGFALAFLWLSYIGPVR